mgnify:CR=1 FL=1
MANDALLPLLDEQSVRAGLSSVAAGLLVDLQVHKILDSTNAELLRRVGQGPLSGLVCVAEQQSAGRGRRGRQWVSPFASNIYLSIGWGFSSGTAALEGLSLAVGVAVAEALEACDISGLQLKWPNDLLFRGAKLGGILVEMVGDASGSCQVVVGVGLNVQMPATSASTIDQAWTDLATDAGASPDRNPLLSALLNHLLPLLGYYEAEGFSVWKERWEGRNAFAGQEVVVLNGERRTVGTMQGIDDTGALRLSVGGIVQTFHGGEVSLRLAQ